MQSFCRTGSATVAGARRVLRDSPSKRGGSRRVQRRRSRRWRTVDEWEWISPWPVSRQRAARVRRGRFRTQEMIGNGRFSELKLNWTLIEGIGGFCFSCQRGKREGNEKEIVLCLVWYLHLIYEKFGKWNIYRLIEYLDNSSVYVKKKYYIFNLYLKFLSLFYYIWNNVKFKIM